MTPRFAFLDKAKKEELLPVLFELLYRNMNEIAPSGEGKEADWALWHEQVSRGLTKAPRQIVLIYADDALAGYFQYYCNEARFVMEEFQLKPPFWGTGLFSALYRYLLPLLPPDTKTVEAWTHPQNPRSQSILEHLGLTCQDKGARFYHYVGTFETLLTHFSL